MFLETLSKNAAAAWAKCVVACMLFCFASFFSFAQPGNDNCANAEVITISNGGYGAGTFTSTNVDITAATVQPGETFAPALLVASQNQKSVWFKFTIPTTRKIRVTLQQPAATIPAGDVGFAVYKANTCIPTGASLSTKLTPIGTFGNTFHPCVDSGVYLVQVSSRSTTSGSLSIQIISDFTGADYDRPADAYSFGLLSVPTAHVDFSVECQSFDDGNEICASLFNPSQYTKSTWHIFQTPNYFDYLAVMLASPTGSFVGGQQVFGYKLFKGNAKTTPVAALVLAAGCDSFKTAGNYPDYKLYKCGQLENNTTYSIQIFYKQSFAQDIRLAITYAATGPTKAPEPILSSMSASNILGALPSSPSGISTSVSDFLGCNARHSIHPCGDALPANGLIVANNPQVRYNLSTFYTFTLVNSAKIYFYGYTTGCYQNPLLRVYSQGISNNCASLTNTSLLGTGIGYLTLECLMPGTYTVQISGQDTAVSNTSYNYFSMGGSGPICLRGNLGAKVDLTLATTSVKALSNFSLSVTNAYDKINGMAPLQNGSTYMATADTFGCSPTVLPAGPLCDTLFNKAIYREFIVVDSGLVTMTNFNSNSNYIYKLFRGDADALATQQNKHAFPDRITGLSPNSPCMNYYSSNCYNYNQACVVPDTYTLGTFGSTAYINQQDRPSIKFEKLVTKHYSPETAQNMGSILDSALSALNSDIDYFSCKDNAVTINGRAPCMVSSVVAQKAIYRQFYLKNPASVAINSNYSSCSYVTSKALFKGKATDGIAALQPMGTPWNCFTSMTTTDCRPLEAGWYTIVTYANGPSYGNPLRDYNSSLLNRSEQIIITVIPQCAAPKFNRPYKASIDAITGQPYLIDFPNDRATSAYTKCLAQESFNCTLDTPFISTINPCVASHNRVAYYVFKTTRAMSLRISFTYYLNVYFSVYKLDVRTDSALIPTTSPVLSCSSASAGAQLCKLPAGTYTIVITGGNDLSCNTLVPCISKPCNEPWYNRPYKAAVNTATNQPFAVDWAPRAGHTNEYPKTDTLYNFPPEYFDCGTDLPFASHPIAGCNTTLNRVAYYVFKVTKESFIQINTQNFWSAVYPLDVRNDSTLFSSTTPVQPCVQGIGAIQLCKLQPGVYTLVVFADNSNACTFVTPKLYIDQVGYSRFDFANKAYDFGMVAPDSLWHNGKTGDVNPLFPGRAPSNDFFYCTTGAAQTDPTNSICNTVYNANIYSNTTKYLFSGSISNYTYTPRRNLWYTFVTDKPGNVRVRVNNKTLGKQYQYRYAVYKSNVDGSLPFTTVVSGGQVDSTVAQGLSFITQNLSASLYCYGSSPEVTFYRPPCTNTPERYYVLVENPNPYDYYYNYDPALMLPNSQAEVSILIDSVNSVPTKFDHYSQAGNFGTIGAGTFTGPTDNFNCASRDVPDPVYGGMTYCTKTIWYKFTTSVTGSIRFRQVSGTSNFYDNGNIQLFKQMIPGDSTINGLQYQSNTTSVYDNGVYWGETCIAAGTYYLLLPGCNMTNEFVYPVIKIIEQAGDFCTAPVVTPLNGPGNASSSVIVNCHTIGTDYGEFNPMLTCPANTPTATYKSSWFRLDIGGNDTLDVTAFLSEATTALSSQIKYRMMTGNCGAMQEQSCVLDALTQNTYKCLTPGSYFFQVFTPTAATGTIDLKLTAVKHADTCAPVNNCLANANFLTQYDCTLNDSVRFINYSTYGNAIQYNWNFGYNGQSSTAVSPSFSYPALATAQTYTITLAANNTSCNGLGNTSAQITIPGRPNVNLGKDTSLCNGGSVILNATTHTGSVYQWSTGATTPSITASTPGLTTYWVKVTYNNCIKRDTIKVFINPIIGRKQSKLFCNDDSVQLSSFRGNGESYLWSTGATSNSIYASAPGTYYCDLILNGCIKRDTFNVTRASFSFGNDTAVCIKPGVPFVLNATSTGATSYAWQNGSLAPSFSVTAAGQYWVRITFGACTVRDTVNISVLQPIVRSQSANLCVGQNYTLPSGAVVTTAGTYSDTARTANGCDSLITSTTLTLKNVTRTNASATICAGQWYSLPSGTAVNAPGIYKDTLAYVGGCDSVITTLSLVVKTAQQITANPTICAGSSYTLPSGTLVNTAGVYYDTLRYVSGCDSVRFTTNLLVGQTANASIQAAICNGIGYMLPSGNMVNIAGTYYDTLKYVAGCDSIRYTVHVAVRPVLSTAIQASFCAGQTFVLPSGTTVSTPGIYKDTLRYANGCDSMIRTTTLTLKTVSRLSASPSICAGQTFTLPSGAVVSNAGTYQDTLRYLSGCDSVIHTVTLKINTVTNKNSAASICQGAVYTLPWGALASIAGNYSDTLRGSTGCDSIITIVALTVTPKPSMGITPTTASVCEKDTLQLKAFGGASYKWIQGSGILSPTVANTSVYPAVTGNYRVSIYEPVCNIRDTFLAKVTVEALPNINILKSNDINCIKGTAQLTATGGARYTWWPTTGINNINAPNPIVSPSNTVYYYVRVATDKNCLAEDSIQVKVSKADMEKGFLVPSAFTPDGDGVNDCFGIRSWGAVTNVHFDIYGRFGQKVFSTTDPSKCWDGRYKGQLLDPAAFIYQISASTFCGAIVRKGTVVLIR